MKSERVLHRYLPPKGQSASLDSALRSWERWLRRGGRVLAIVQALTYCEFATLDDGELRRCQPGDGTSDSDPLQPLEIAQVFDARVFSWTGELRWLNDPQGEHHRSVFLADDEVEKELPPDWVPAPITYSRTIEQAYILWGKAHSSPDVPRYFPQNWTRLSTAQIGILDAPVCDVPRGGRVALCAREYCKVVDDCHGNVGVFEERLLGLRFEEVRGTDVRS